MVTKDKTRPEADKSQELKDKAVSSKMDKVLDGMLSPARPATALPEKEGTTPEAKTYSQEDYDKAVNEGKMWQGRVKDFEVLSKENTTLKAQLAAKGIELTNNAAEIDKLQDKFDNLAQDDPAKFEVAKELKSAREERRQLQSDRQSLDAEKQAHDEDIKFAYQTTKEIKAWDISAEYEGGDAVILKNLCDAYEKDSGKRVSEEKMRELASAIWSKVGGEPPKPTVPIAPKAYSGHTEGGNTGRLTRQSLASYSPQGKTGKDFANDQEQILDRFFKK